MKLFLASEGSDVRTTKSLEEFIGGYKNKSVVYIPTARNGENQFNTWQDSNTWRFLNSSGMDVSYVQLEDHKDYLSPKLFENKDLIWMSGGASGYLMYWIKRTGFDLLLPKILEKSIYVGSSAGAMITGLDLDVSEWFIGEDERGAHYLPSLKLVDFDIYPHYQEEQLEEIKKRYTGKKMYLLKNGEQIIVDGDKIEVQGEERIIFGEGRR